MMSLPLLPWWISLRDEKSRGASNLVGFWAKASKGLTESLLIASSGAQYERSDKINEKATNRDRLFRLEEFLLRGLM